MLKHFACFTLSEGSPPLSDWLPTHWVGGEDSRFKKLRKMRSLLVQPQQPGIIFAHFSPSQLLHSLQVIQEHYGRVNGLLRVGDKMWSTGSVASGVQ